MSKNSEKDMPRRKFLKNFGSGVLGTSVLLKNLPAKNQESTKDSSPDKQSEQGKVEITLTVNGREKTVKVFPQTTLAQLIRDEMQLTGTKITGRSAALRHRSP